MMICWHARRGIYGIYYIKAMSIGRLHPWRLTVRLWKKKITRPLFRVETVQLLVFFFREKLWRLAKHKRESYIRFWHYCWWLKSGVHQLRSVVEIPWFTRFYTFQVVVWDFFHQQYHWITTLMSRRYPSWKLMVGRLNSFWETSFSGAMLASGGVPMSI